MATFSLDNAEVVRAVLLVMGLNRDASNMDAATEADVRAIIRAGLRRAYFPTQGELVYQWRWLEKYHPIAISAVYQTGTIEVASGTVTLSGGTWPAHAVDMFLRVDGHTLFVTERTSDTVLEVSNTGLTVSAGTSYSAHRYRYDLPSDFGEWLGGVVYADGTNSRPLAGADESELRLRYAIGQGTNTRTSHYAIVAQNTTKDILFWPVPEPDAFVQGVYLSVPDDNLPADLTTPGSVAQVQPIYAEAFLESILAAAEDYREQPGIHTQRADIAMRSAIAHDKSIGGYYDFSHRLPDTKSCGQVLPIDWTDALI